MSSSCGRGTFRAPLAFANRLKDPYTSTCISYDAFTDEELQEFVNLIGFQPSDIREVNIATLSKYTKSDTLGELIDSLLAKSKKGGRDLPVRRDSKYADQLLPQPPRAPKRSDYGIDDDHYDDEYYYDDDDEYYRDMKPPVAPTMRILKLANGTLYPSYDTYESDVIYNIPQPPKIRERGRYRKGVDEKDMIPKPPVFGQSRKYY